MLCALPRRLQIEARRPAVAQVEDITCCTRFQIAREAGQNQNQGGLLVGSGAAGSGSVVVADKDQSQENDVFRCLDADTGREIWNLTYPAAGKLDYTNSPRANPVIWPALIMMINFYPGSRVSISLCFGPVTRSNRKPKAVFCLNPDSLPFSGKEYDASPDRGTQPD